MKLDPLHDKPRDVLPLSRVDYTLPFCFLLSLSPSYSHSSHLPDRKIKPKWRSAANCKAVEHGCQTTVKRGWGGVTWKRRKRALYPLSLWVVISLSRYTVAESTENKYNHTTNTVHILGASLHGSLLGTCNTLQPTLDPRVGKPGPVTAFQVSDHLLSVQIVSSAMRQWRLISVIY